MPVTLPQKTIDAIIALAAKSDAARYRWRDRGGAPAGYIKGMAVTFGLMLTKLKKGDSAAKAMVRVVDGPGDVFDHLDDELERAGLRTLNAPDVDRLRALFVILLGLGMRESSGRYCEGRDRSASNTTADTAEAGLFQQSWDSRGASPELKKLLDSYQDEGLLKIFKEGVTPRTGDLDNYGSGDGLEFQELCKGSPDFAVQCAAIGLRTLYRHWGPIIRKEVEIRPEANALFLEVQRLVGDVPVEKPAKSWATSLAEFFSNLFKRSSSTVPVPAKPVSQTPWMTWAEKEVGFHEVGTNRNISRYTTPAHCGSEGDPWCAIFVNAGFESVGIPGTRSAMARSFERHPAFLKLDGPAYGAVVTMWRNSPSSGLGHVFFYLGENDRGVIALGGNQDDQVCRQYEPRNRIVGYYWPKSVPLPKIGKIILSNINAKEGSET